MQDFSITTTLSLTDYAKVYFLGVIRKPAFILIPLFGLYMMYHESYIMGVFFIVAPVLATWTAVRRYKSNADYNSVIQYTFGENGIRTEAPSCTSDYAWSHIVKYQQISHFIILYHGNNTGNIIDVQKLTPEQLQFIRYKVDAK